MQSGMNQEISSSEDTNTKMTRESLTNLKLNDDEKESGSHESTEEFREEAVEEEEEEFSFSLAFAGAKSPIAAEDAFYNGQIKPIYPLFNQYILMQEVMENSIANVKKVFVEAGSLPATAASTYGKGDTAETYCHLEKKEVEVEVAVAQKKACKKSNSTGFSKFWRFRNFMHRSSSDGKDAFVFLKNNNKNNNTTSSPGITRSSKKKAEKAARKAEKEKKAVAESTVNGDEGKVKVAAGEKGKAKAKKDKTAASSSHEVYVRSKSREQDRRRSYLPNLPEKVGFFTNITGGGLTKNMHPF